MLLGMGYSTFILSCAIIIGVSCTENVYIITNHDFSCDNESVCLTINQLTNFSHMNRVSLEFHPGTHVLNKSEHIVFDGINEVRIVGHSQSEVLCIDSSGLTFLSIGELVLSNVSFRSCGARVQADAFNYETAIFLHLVSNFSLDGINVFNSIAVGMFISETYGEAQIQNSVISGSSISNMIWSSRSEYSHPFTLTIENLAVMHGGSVSLQKSTVSGGMNIFISAARSGSIVLNNINFHNNSGHTGGNLQIAISYCVYSLQSIDVILSNSLISFGKAFRGAGLAYVVNCDHCGLEHQQLNTSHTFLVQNSVITHNQAIERGGGLDIFIDNTVYVAKVCFQNLSISSNVVTSRPFQEQSKHVHLFTGGGLNFYAQENLLVFIHTPVLLMNDCTFVNNSAYFGAGFYVAVNKISYTFSPHEANSSQMLISIYDLKSVRNNAHNGAGGMLSVDSIALPYDSLLTHQVSINLSSFEGNYASGQGSGLLISSSSDNTSEFDLESVSFSNNSLSTWSSDSPSTLFVNLVIKLSLNNCTFYNNSGSGMGTMLSRIIVNGPLNFSHNTAAIGAGTNLRSSHLKLATETFITFQHNHASEVGGAIYASNMASPCFYSILHSGQAFKFMYNSASLGGDNVYEPRVGICTLLNSTQDSDLHRVSVIVPQNVSLISSDPYQVCRCHQKNAYGCESRSLSVSVITGSQVVLSFILTDKNGQPTPGFISSFLKNYGNYDKPILYSELSIGLTCLEVIYPSTLSDHLFLVPKNYQHHEVGIYKPFDVFLYPLPCPAGFYMSIVDTKCDCLPHIKSNPFLQCNVSDFTVTRLEQVWISLEQTSNISIYSSCPFDYCTSGKVVLQYLNTSICASGRSGMLCGECQDSLSFTLGNNHCTECSSNFIALILVFGALGVLLVILITVLSLTITEGAVIGVIFSISFLHLNRLSFFPQYNNTNIFVILISWMNLDFGFNVCFYNGLTSYAKVWLQLSFPLYLYIIEIVINICSYYSSKLARVTGARNRLKIMSTIFLLGYMKILRALVSVFPFATIESPYNPNDVRTVWVIDGNMEYYSRHHIPLFIAAVLFLIIVLLPYTSYLLFVQVLQRLPRLPCKLKRDGIFDAHVGPFKEKCRFWLGLLLFSYTVLVILHYFTGGDQGTNLTALIVTCPLLLLLKILYGGVYKNKIVDVLESILFFIVFIFSAITLQLKTSNTGNITTVLYIMLTLMFFTIFVTVIYHLYSNFYTKSSNCTNLLTCKCCMTRPSRQHDPWSNNYQHLSEEDISLDTFQTDYQHASQLMNEDETGTDSDKMKLVPSSWLPTAYPTPVYREDPDLLQFQDPVTTSNSSETKSPIHEVIKIKSSVLVVDETEEDANLIPWSSSDTMRSQRLSMDVSGNQTFVIEDYPNVISEQENLAVSCYKPSQGHDKSLVAATKVKKGSDASVQKLPPTSTNVEKLQTAFVHNKAIVPSRNSGRRNSVTKQLSRKKCNTRMSRRPPAGTTCFKCDPSLSLLSKIKRFKVDRSGDKFSMEPHGVTLTIPPEAIREDGASIIDIEVGVLMTGPFVFPPRIRPISPIVWICIRNTATLCKPIDITLPHFVNRLNSGDVKKLGMRFMKASHHARLEDGKKRFIFDLIGNDSTTSFSPKLGKLKTHHFCFLCIAALESRHLYEHASYCLIRVDPIAWSPALRKQDIYFIVTYNMPTCLKVNTTGYIYFRALQFYCLFYSALMTNMIRG